MSRWALPISVLVCVCGWLFLHRGSGPMLSDTDTAVALRAIEARHNALSWFVTDWPLENHFYRPLPTLSLALDLAVYGHNAAGFAVTNVILCVLGVLALFWFAYELTESPAMAAASSVLMGAWLATGAGAVGDLFRSVALIAFLVGLVRHREHWRIYVPVALVLYYAGMEINGVGPGLSQGLDLWMRTIGWVPGRTATIMALFAMISVAAYVRMERLGANRDPQPEPTATDLPATRTSVQYPVKRFVQWPWALLSVGSALLAFASYEQAVMLPAVLLGAAILLRTKGVQVRWGWQIAYWAMIPGYLLLRHAVIPSTVSRYQGQQLRFGPTVYYDLVETLIPSFSSVQILSNRLDLGWTLLLDFGNFVLVLFLIANAVSLWKTRERWQTTSGVLILAFLAYMPMAWLKYFGHYLYWPAMFRSLFAVGLAWIGIEGLVSVASPRARQAPLRPSPAPGSLPHQ